MVLDQFFRLAGPDREDARVWNLVFLGRQRSFLCVANENGLLLARPLPEDLSDGADPDEYLGRLTTEIERSVFFARQSEGSPRVDRIVICGDRDRGQRLVERLQDDDTHAAEFWDLTGAVDPGDHDVDVDDQILLAMAALASAGATVNVAPAASRSLIGRVGGRRLGLAVATAAVAVVPLLTVGSVITDRVQETYLADARERLVVATELAEQAAAIYAREQALRARELYLDEYAGGRQDLDGVLLLIAGLTPPEVRYRDLQLTGGRGRVRLDLTGESTAPTVSEAQQAFMTFHAALGAAPQLRALGEPRELEILEVEEGDTRRKTVRFALNYELVAAPDRKDG
jgi:hypothetical protein